MNRTKRAPSPGVFSRLSPRNLLACQSIVPQLSIDKVVNGKHRGLLFTLGVGFVLLIGLQTLLGALRSWTTLYSVRSFDSVVCQAFFSLWCDSLFHFFEKRNLGDIISRFDQR